MAAEGGRCPAPSLEALLGILYTTGYVQAEAILVAEYEGGVLATGFSIPAYTVPIVRDLAKVFDADDREEAPGTDAEPC